MIRNHRRSRKTFRLIEVLAIAVVLWGATAIVFAQTAEKLNGTWKLNAAKSRFASAIVPENVSEHFETDGRILRETLTTVRSGVESITRLDYQLDGKESVNHVDDEVIKTTARWDGMALVLEWKDQGGTVARRFVLDKNGRFLTLEVHDSDRNIPSGDLVVLEKQ